MQFSLQSISLANFRGVTKTLTLNFTDLQSGLYFIRGRNEVEPRLGSNGASKSTLFVDSIYWALTGKVARSSRPGADVENWGSGKATTSVDFNFLLDDAPHTIRRTRNPNSIELDGKKVEQQELDNLLPLTDSALRRSILIDQFGEMFLSLRPEDKSRIFSETLGLDIWLKASDKAGKSVSDFEKAIQRAETELSGIAGALVEARSQFEIMETKEVEFETGIKSAIADKRQTLVGTLAHSQEAKLALDNARDAFSTLSDASKRKWEAENLRTLLRQRQKTIVSASSAVQLSWKEAELLQHQLDKYGSVDKVCPECGQPVADKHIELHITELKIKITANETKRAQLIKAEKSAELAFDGLSKEIANLEKDLVEFNSVQSKVAICAERSLSADNQVQQVRQEIKELQERVNPYTDQCDKLEIRIKELVTKRKNLKSTVDEINKQLEIAKFWQRGFKEIRLEQIDTTLMELELTANKHAEALGLDGWGVSFATERETQKGTVSHGFSIFLRPPNQSDPISFESYSGGETQRLQLATTFGLAEVLLARSGVSTDFEVLDEPTVHLSPEGVDDLLTCLRDRALELNRRIFVIDHHALDRGLFDGIFTVIKNQKGVYIEDGGLLSVKKERVRL